MWRMDTRDTEIGAFCGINGRSVLHCSRFDRVERKNYMYTVVDEHAVFSELEKRKVLE